MHMVLHMWQFDGSKFFQMSTITKQQLQDLINQNKLVVDVREPDEFAEGCIPSSVNLPLSKLPEALELSSNEFQKQYGFKKPEKNQDFAIYCRSGKRSGKAFGIFSGMGYSNLKDFSGGWMGWSA
jgi:rhodanese-related sulfurtransferase